jgi:hypothetical protein
MESVPTTTPLKVCGKVYSKIDDYYFSEHLFSREICFTIGQLTLQEYISTIFSHIFAVSFMNTAHGEVSSIQHYVIKFVSALRQVGGFLMVFWLPPPIKLTATI